MRFYFSFFTCSPCPAGVEASSLGSNFRLFKIFRLKDAEGAFHLFKGVPCVLLLVPSGLFRLGYFRRSGAFS